MDRNGKVAPEQGSAATMTDNDKLSKRVQMMERTYEFICQKELKQCGDEQTNTYGYIEFVDFDEHSSKDAPYIRLDSKTEAGDVYELLKKYWKMKKPNVIISVLHDGSVFEDKHLAHVLSHGLFRTAVNIGGWIITSGLDTEDIKKVWTAIKKQKTDNNEVTILGIANWKNINNRCELEKSVEGRLVTYKKGNLSSDHVQLESHHTHFIMIDTDDESDTEKDPGYDFHMQLLEYISNEIKLTRTDGKPWGNEENYISIPILFIDLCAEMDSILMVDKALESGASVIMVKGSGRATNLITKVIMRSRAGKSHSNSIEKAIEGCQDDDLSEDMKQSLKNICQNFPEKITIFDMKGGKYKKTLDAAILSTIFKTSPIAQHMEELGPYCIELCMKLGQYDIAEKQILDTKNRAWKSHGEEFVDLVLTALVENKTNFFILLTEHLVTIQKFFEKVKLENLYEKVVEQDSEDRTSTNEILAERLPSRTSDGKAKVNLENVKMLLGELTEEDYEFSFEFDDSKKNTNHNMHLFLWALLLNRMSFAKLFWQRLSNGNIAAALIASSILQTLSEYAEKNEQLVLRSDLKRNAKEFEDLAIAILERCYNSDKKRAKLLLVRRLKDWGRSTCIQIAYSSRQMNFIEHDSCQSKLKGVWKGNLQLNSKRQWCLFMVAVLLPFIIPFMTFVVKDMHKARQRDVSDWEDKSKIQRIRNFLFRNNRHAPRTNNREQEVRHYGGHTHDVSLREGLLYFYSAPVTKFTYDLIFYLFFLGTFAVFLLTDLHPRTQPMSPSVMEWVVLCWVVTLVVEEIREIAAQEPKSVSRKASSWISEVRNKFDVVMFILYFISLTLRFALSPDQFSIARIMYSITFIFFCIRLLPMGFVNPYIGPKVIMILEMLTDLLYFAVILIIFMVGFGIANEAILYPNMYREFFVIAKALYKPYWQLYGELFLEEIEGLDNETCLHDPRYRASCPNIEENYRWVVPTLTAIYMMISNILLINLLIAMFSYTFTRVQDKAETIWRFYLCGLIYEYLHKPPFPPPLTVPYYIWLLIKFIKAICSNKGKSARSRRHRYHALRVAVESKAERAINSFEHNHMKAHMENQEDIDSIKSNVVSIRERVDQLYEGIKDVQDRLSSVQDATEEHAALLASRPISRISDDENMHDETVNEYGDEILDFDYYGDYLSTPEVSDNNDGDDAEVY